MKMFQIALLVACLSSVASAEIPLLFEGNEWSYMERVFMTRINEEKSSMLYSLKKLGITAGTGFVAAIAGHTLHELSYATGCTNADDFEMDAGAYVMFPMVAGIAAGHYWGAHVLETRLFKKTLKKFVKKWPENSRATPVELHPFFNELWHEYARGTNATIEKKGVKIVQLIRSLVEEHFPEKYITQKVQVTAHSTSVAFKLDVTQLFSALFSSH